jgi:alpha-ketoglutarate-dependent taurine dioxygenase
LTTQRQLPKIIEEIGFDFHWDEEKVWDLEVSVESMPLTELNWHFDVPFLWTKPDGFYDLKPSEVIDYPQKYVSEYERTMNADTKYPIDIMHWRGRWVILDGLHRLMKLYIEGIQEVDVRKIPQSAIPRIKSDKNWGEL